MVISFLTLACSSPGAIGRLPSRAENMGAVGLRGGSPVEAAALLGPLLLLLLLRGGGVAATSADCSLSRPRMYFLAASIEVPGCGIFRRSHLTKLQDNDQRLTRISTSHSTLPFTTTGLTSSAFFL